MKKMVLGLLVTKLVVWLSEAAQSLRLDSVDWSPGISLLEGRTVLLRFQGTNLSPDMTLEWVANGTPLGSFSQYTTLGTNAGVKFHLPQLPGLHFDQVLPGELRLRSVDGSTAAWPLTVHGLNEFQLNPGETFTITNRSEATFSRIDIPAGARVEVHDWGAIDWRSTGPVVIAGEINAMGADGADAVGSYFPGPAGRNGGAGGHGGIVGIPNPSLPTAGADGSHPLNARRVSVTGGFQFLEPAGMGGVAGNNLGAAMDIPCLSFQREVGDMPPFECSAAVNTLFEYARLANRDRSFAVPLLAGAQGWSALGVDERFPRPRPGHGGGGGGGGGAASSFGGGGGAGGDGGRGVRILGGSSLHLSGWISTEGGRGGNGWRADSAAARLPALPTLGDLTTSGGGGGGGAPGELILASRGPFIRPPQTRVFSDRGGQPGQGGVQWYDATAIRGEPWVERSVLRVTEGRHADRLGFWGGPVVDSELWDDLVTAAGLLELTITSTERVVPRTFEIRGEDVGQVRVVNVAGVTNRFSGGLESLAPPYRLALPLFRGFNTITARPTDLQEPQGEPAYEILFRRILSLTGCDTACDALAANPYLENGYVRYFAGDGITRAATDVARENVPARHTGLRADEPLRLAYGPDGSLYFTQTAVQQPGLPVGIGLQRLIRRVTPDGLVRTVAGGGTNTSENIRALDALLSQQIEALSIAPDGGICFLERAAPPIPLPTPPRPLRVRRVDPDGTIRTIVGGGAITFVPPVAIATAIELNPPGGAVNDGGLGHDAAGNLYLSHRFQVTYVLANGTSQIRPASCISRVSPAGEITRIIGGNAPGFGAPRYFDWGNTPALGCVTFPEKLAVAPNGTVYFYESSGRLVAVAEATASGEYFLRHLTGQGTLPSTDRTAADGRLATDVSFIGAWSLALGTDGCLHIANGVLGTNGVNTVGAYRKVTPAGTCWLVLGGGAASGVTPTNGQPARYGHSPYYTGDIAVGPDNRLTFVGLLGGGAAIGKVLQPHDPPSPPPEPPVAAFATSTMVVWENSGTVNLPLVRRGYAGSFHVAVTNLSGSTLNVAQRRRFVTFDTDATDTSIDFVAQNRAGIQGTRTVEFELTLGSAIGNSWSAPLIDPALQERIGAPNRLTLVILDDEAPPPPPQLTVIVPPVAGLELAATVTAHVPYRLQSSTNLIDWRTLSTNASPTGQLQIPINPAFRSEFFRLLQLLP